ncbi:tensin-3 [Pyxicephalus adspersus]|uniref:tensin-3 n=1 Tax=Pyxicephalus adspersus TaxID=30357 RepID=UPI003B5958B9
MEEGELDLTFITERIISVSFSSKCSNETYLQNLQEVTQMLKLKHGDNYLVLNISEKSCELSRLNTKVMDMGWPELHAPPLDKMCSICKAMESWMNSDPLHVVVIHCRGGKGRIGVVISSYMHFTNVSLGADQALDRFAMKKFFDDKVSVLMHPSQKRYVRFLNELLSGVQKMNTVPVYMHYVILHGIPNFYTTGGCQPFIKVYQAMQHIYTSEIYNVVSEAQERLYIAIEPAQLIKGDIMIKCYHESYCTENHNIVFSLQFHTGAVHGQQMYFGKEDLDHANNDNRFQDCGKIELVFSRNLENLSVPHSQSLADGSVYTRFGNKSPIDRSLPVTDHSFPIKSKLDNTDPTLSGSSDSGHSTDTIRTKTVHNLRSRIKRDLSSKEKAELDRLLDGFGVDVHLFSQEDMTDVRSKYSGTHNTLPIQIHRNGNTKLSDRETDILDDEMPNHDLHSVDSIGTLSSSEGQHSNNLLSLHLSSLKSSQNSLLSDGCYSNTADERNYNVTPDLGINIDQMFEKSYNIREPKQPQQTVSQVPPDNNYSTQTWVHEQMISSHHYCFSPGKENPFGISHRFDSSLNIPNTSIPPSVCNTGFSNRDLVLMSTSTTKQDDGPGIFNDLLSVPKSPNWMEENNEDIASSPTLDIDQSIEQLNKLILELDPTFELEPVEISSCTTGANKLLSGYSVLSSPLDAERKRKIFQEGSKPNTPSASSREQSLGLYENTSNKRYEWKRCPEDEFISRSFTRMEHLPSREEIFSSYQEDDVMGKNFSYPGNRNETDVAVSPTPCFPFTPETLYEKQYCSEGLQRELPSESIDRTNSDFFMTELQRSSSHRNDNFSSREEGVSEAEKVWMERSLKPSTPYQSSLKERNRVPEITQELTVSLSPVNLNSGITSGMPTLETSSLDCVAADVQEIPQSRIVQGNCNFDRFLNANNNPTFNEKQVLYFSSTNASPKILRSQFSVDNNNSHYQSSPLLQNVEKTQHSQPPLPEKKRVSESERSFGSISPSSSGFSSPHSGSTISIPFPNFLPDFSKSITDSSLPDISTDIKHMTVKFVQDTSKFWYKPEISREQAIAVLKDKEPGSFIVRDSHSFRGAYGLAMKVATPPPSVMQLNKKVSDMTNELVRHFLIECVQKGVRLKGCPNEPYFGSLTALIYQHSITPLALPCKLLIPDKDHLEDIAETVPQTAANSAAELLKQGAACNVWYLNSVEMESLTGYQAVQKALSITLNQDPPPVSTVVHFKVSAQGITLTDNQRKLFFRRHYPVNTVIFCALDPQDRKWKRDGLSAKVFGFVARKGNGNENICYLFAEHDPEQPASAIVNFVSKVMIGSLRKI